ncbi:MAG: helix-turn-helix domain-containing protein, partial [Candidatus Woesearchaeota archaeon]
TNIKKTLDSKDISMYWLADKTGLSYTTVYNLANNKTQSIHFKTLEKIMKVLNINNFNEILEIVPDEK